MTYSNSSSPSLSTSSLSSVPNPSAPNSSAAGAARRLEQLRAVARLELRRQLLGPRALVTGFLAFAPLALVLLWALRGDHSGAGPVMVTPAFAALYAGYVASSLFLSCLVQFTSLFRAEIMERTLHYALLTPVPRSVLVLGKFCAAFFATASIYAVSTTLLFLAMFSAWGPSALMRYLGGPGLGNLVAYVSVAVLACLGYGALFLLAGLLFRNPVIPALMLWAWESINFLVPSFLKKLSVSFYLTGLYPVPLEEKAFAVLAESVPAWLAVPGLLLFTAGVLALATWRARRFEISYGAD